MTATIYDIRYYDAQGVALGDLNAFVRCSWSRAVNNGGGLEIELPPIYPAGWFEQHRRIAVYRGVNGGSPALDGECYWIVTRVQQRIDTSGERRVVVRAVDPLWLLGRRIVDYYAGTANATKTAVAAGNQIKAFVRENYTAPTDTSRTVAAASLTVQANLGDGASIAATEPWRTLLPVCQDIAQASTTAGTYLAFDLVCTDPTGALEFRTYASWRGVDHRFPSGSAGPVLIGPDYGNLVDVTSETDWEAEVTRGIAAGQGTESNRVVQRSTDTARSTLTPWALSEDFYDARNSADTATVLDDADALVRNGRPRVTVSGTYQDTPGVVWGLHIGYGDVVTVTVDGVSSDCRIDAYGITVSSEGERIDVVLRSVT